MSENFTKQATLQNDDDEPIDLIEELYIGHFDRLPGIVQTSLGELPIALSGEVLLYGTFAEDQFLVHELRRVALYGELEDPDLDDRIGVLSLSSRGSVSPTDDGVADNIVLQLHYAALTDELEPAFEGDDYVLPVIEQISATLHWEVEEAVATMVQLEIALKTDELIDSTLGLIEALTLLPESIEFVLAGTGAPRPRPTFTLPSNCPPLPPDCLPSRRTVSRTLPVKFINLSSHDQANGNIGGTGKNLERLCRDQLESVCNIWGHKSAFDPTIQGSIEEGNVANKRKYSSCSKKEEGTINELGYAEADKIEVYLVDILREWPGGGSTHNCNQASAYCILSIGQMINNSNLLAHELCHVLGLCHPDGGCAFLGSDNTIAEPGTPNPDNQSTHNLGIFGSTHPLNPLVQTTATPDCFRPDFFGA